MASFDFITAKEFRESLEADYSEMNRCWDAQAWKSVQVLAGSIVEALLIDYLASTKHPARSGREPLKMDLSEAIAICRSETVLSDRNADLCSVVKSYRNLIHPGRMVRLAEQQPTKASSSVAMALVEIIALELAEARRKLEGLTGEQILSKIQRDANVLTILKHLLSEVNSKQQERLLLELIPPAHLAASDIDCDETETVQRLESAYRLILESASDNVRRLAAAEFVRVLKEEDGAQVQRYCAAFFRPKDLKFVPSPNQAIVKEYFLGRVSAPHTLASLRLISGISRHLETSDVKQWLDPFVTTILSTTTRPDVRQDTREHLVYAAGFTSPSVDEAVDQRLDEWIRFFKEEGEPENAEQLRALKLEIDAQRIPF